MDTNANLIPNPPFVHDKFHATPDPYSFIDAYVYYLEQHYLDPYSDYELTGNREG